MHGGQARTGTRRSRRRRRSLISSDRQRLLHGARQYPERQGTYRDQQLRFRRPDHLHAQSEPMTSVTALLRRSASLLAVLTLLVAATCQAQEIDEAHLLDL